MLTEEVSFILREKRRERSLSQIELVQLTGLSRIYLSYLETGDRLPSLEVLHRIANVYNCQLKITFMCKSEECGEDD